MARTTGRRLLFPSVALITLMAAAAVMSAMRLGLFQKFEVDGMKINPRAAIRDDVTYELTVWEEAFIAPWAAEHQTKLLDRAIEEFVQRYPDATVNITYSQLDETTARAQLTAAIDAGRPPDVYGTVRSVLIGLPRQVPASPYMPTAARSEQPPFSPAAIGGLSVDGTVWGWPRAMWWDVWMGRRAALERGGLDPARLATDGWDYDALLQWKKVTPERATIALDLTDVRLLEQLMGASGAPSYADGAGQIAWDEERLAKVAALVRALQQSGALARDAELMSRTRLETLYGSTTGVIGPVNPYVAQSALRRTSNESDELVLVPVPRLSEAPSGMPVTVSAYFVFHQELYQGDDHTRLAQELAAFLASKSEAWLIESIGLIPASTGGWAVWHERSPLDPTSRTVLEHGAQHATAAPAGTAAGANDSIRTALLPHWQAFISGDLTPEQFAQSAVRTIDRTLSAHR